MVNLRRKVHKYALPVLCAGVILAPITASAQYSGVNPATKTITVYGEAEIMAKPDVAYIPMDITTTAPIIDDAYKENKVKIQNTVDKLKELGIKSDWIKVMDAQPYKIEQYNIGEAPIFGISNILVVTIPRVDKMKPEELRKRLFSIAQGVSRTTITAYAAASSSPGSNRISTELSGMGYYGHYPIAIFGVTNYKELEEKVSIEAIEDANKEAKRLAGLLGVELKEITYFYQSYPYSQKSTAGSQETILPEGPKSNDPKNVKIYAAFSVAYSFE